ncbi:MAG TPA: flagellar protein FlgN [Firmicutes bacterium]|nr:flagellar protein FlgN [Bacillota bacterium]
MEQQNTSLFLLSSLNLFLDTLIESAKEKQRLVIVGDCSGLEQIIRKEEKTLQDLQAIQERLGAEPLLLPDEPDSGETLDKLKQEAAQKVRQLQVLNEQNQELISKSLEIVRYELGLFIPQDDYSKTSKTPPIAFDQKA